MNKPLIIILILVLLPLVYAIDFEYNKFYGMQVFRNDVLKGGCFNTTVSLTPSIAFYTTGDTGTQPVSGEHDFRLAIYENQNCSSLLLYNQSYTKSIIDGFLNVTLTNMTIIVPKIALNMTDLNNSFSNLGVNVGFNSTFNTTYAGINTTANIIALLAGNSNWTRIAYQNITNIPTCTGTDKLTFDGTTLSCTADPINNIFDQILNTTSSVTFRNLTIGNNTVINGTLNVSSYQIADNGSCVNQYYKGTLFFSACS